MIAKAHSLPFPQKEFRYERAFLNSVFILLALFAVSYVYLVASSALHVIARNQALQASIQYESTVGELEREYFSLSGTITPSRGETLGLVPVERTQYVRRPSDIGRAPANNNAL